MSDLDRMSDEQLFAALKGGAGTPDDMSDEELFAALKGGKPSPAPYDAPGSDVLSAANRGVVNALTFGNADRLAAGAMAIGPGLVPGGQSFSEAYASNLEREQATEGLQEATHPTATAVGKYAGAAMGPGQALKGMKQASRTVTAGRELTETEIAALRKAGAPPAAIAGKRLDPQFVEEALRVGADLVLPPGLVSLVRLFLRIRR
jgi:hypothetical protein